MSPIMEIDPTKSYVIVCPDFMTKFFEDFAQALFLAIDEEIMGDSDETVEDEDDAS